ncbi:FecR domain-containing protein [Occallatibacter riparius]|uniref:FecR domain-containing protein n=1 Tax=Occallatibacter riparius TaxID=1002689 RepID=UPI0021B2CF7F|nr:FecR domain-containing protein [Occallatibacter riparius]
MKANWMLLTCVAAGLALGSMQARSQTGEALLASGSISGAFDETNMPATAPDSKEYAVGKQAIHDGRWADAVTIFGKIADAGGPHADSAFYWKAYALNKSGKADEAIGTCGLLRDVFRKSGWIEDCDALQIEIDSSRGKPIQAKAEQSDELKLLALASLMRSDPEKATAQIKEIVGGDASEKLKEGAVFILGQQVPDSTYPQIVRISYLEGDVRIARASENEKSTKPAWETAVMNLPLNEGDSIVTGKDGRVEIEFEDASTVYLGENSVLNCTDMHTTGGVPHTELALVSGTMTTHLDSLMGGEMFLIRTPSENLLARYPEKSDLRITSYIDGIGIASLSGGALNVTGANRVDMTSGKTVFISEGHRVSTAEEAGKAQDFTAYDAWVADRHAARTSAERTVMQEAGLQKPIPGIAEMKDQGHFFECPPYGVCWEPNAPQARPVLAAGPTPPPTPKTASPSAAGRPAGGTNGSVSDWFPCMTAWYPTGYLYSPSSFYALVDPYTWGVCHSGEWIPYNNSYAWVAGTRRHHRIPVRWVKIGHDPVPIPIHPRDVKGKLPINRIGLQPVKGKDGGIHVTPIAVDPGKRMELLKSPPKEFRNLPQPVLARSDAPRMQMLAIRDNAKAGITAHSPIPMTFNHQQGFMTSHQVMQGGRPVAVNVPVGRVGGGGFSGGMPSSGFSGRSSGGVGFGAVQHGGGGFSGGSVSHGGGGVSVGGGGGGPAMHSGGTVSAPSVSTPSASSTAAPASSPRK